MFRKITALKSPITMSVWNNMTGVRIVLLLLLLPVVLLAQSKKELEEKRKKIIRDISTTERMIQKTSQTREATYDKYLALQSQIESRETLIRTIQDEICRRRFDRTQSGCHQFSDPGYRKDAAGIRPYGAQCLPPQKSQQSIVVYFIR